MKHPSAIAATLLLATSHSLPSHAADAAARPPAPDPVRARGEHIARLICATCHVVAADQEFAPTLDQPTPSFSDIANRPGMTAAAIQKFVTSTHWDRKQLPMTMPNLQLTGDEALSVATYILSLRKSY